MVNRVSPTRWFFVFFLVSGFCGLVYEIVWLRLAMASFGVTTPLVATVLSVFMAGLAVGSFVGGRLARRLAGDGGARALRLYSLAEVIIGLSGLVVSREIEWGRQVLSQFAAGAPWGSTAHHAAAGTLLALALLPFCVAMGTTFPLAMGALQQSGDGRARNFSLLYVANVVGATGGTLASALFLIELLGFRGTLYVAAALNALIAVTAFSISFARRWGAERRGSTPGAAEPETSTAPASRLSSAPPAPPSHAAIPWILVMTGLLSMGMEVVWVRQFTPFLGTVVYAFAAILAIYLFATFLGSVVYRFVARTAQRGPRPATLGRLLLLAGLASLLPLVLVDPRLSTPAAFGLGLARVAAAIGPFCFLAGMLTPMMIDRWAAEDPAKAGSAYALNTFGCILGPLLASFALLPTLGERWSLGLLAVPLFVFGAACADAPEPNSARAAWRRAMVLAGGLSTAALVVLLTRDFETRFPRREVRRDYSATVIAAGRGMNRQLLVNGYGMTVLTPTTKMMAHLPLASLREPARNALVICFGMGTSFRSALSWGIPVTAVELIPSVPALYAFFHSDAAEVLARPGARVVIDDGRRFLERSPQAYDVITVDPPPPVEAAGSSLLYSKEFFGVIRSRLAPGGILQQWLPAAEPIVVSSVAHALAETFPNVRVFRSEIGAGLHFLASASPILAMSAESLVARMPAAAQADLVEWQPGTRPSEHFAAVLAREIPLETLQRMVPGAQALRDDRPVNEYFLLRRLHASRGTTRASR
ncbi:MAG: fused MFS/spermidine synthase [Planctomycetes bacterium]|nr:fused MFS/spermidine synthase [Planctomycetota bacterium]